MGKNKKLKWNKPCLVSLGSIAELSMGDCGSGSIPGSCKVGDVAILVCDSGNAVLPVPSP